MDLNTRVKLKSEDLVFSLSLSFSSLLSLSPTGQSDLSVCANASAYLCLEILLQISEVTLSQQSEFL